jgi:ornithine cyclodeaminase/alanine dehydrogenase-like protein (mu-crystallin family)
VRSLAILGAGLQGHTHIEALRQVRQFSDLRIWNRTPERAEQLAAEYGGRCLSGADAVRDADVVVVATASTEPVLDGRWLKPGARVASVGWSGKDGAELDAVTMGHTIIVDSVAGTQTESGNVRRYSPVIRGELGDLLAGRVSVGADETVVLDSIGMACEDIAAAALVCDKLPARRDLCALAAALDSAWQAQAPNRRRSAAMMRANRPAGAAASGAGAAASVGG